jgi:hypothetical protein
MTMKKGTRRKRIYEIKEDTFTHFIQSKILFVGVSGSCDDLNNKAVSKALPDL